MDNSSSSTRQKALKLNLDATTYGTFAEIGAGQEVARWFFSVGGAAGTVAKTISAYDMAMSDALYGRAQRYVSRQRLEAMLAHEFDQLVGSLGPTRGPTSCFFAFADTVTTRSHVHRSEEHTSELQSPCNLVCRLLLEKKKNIEWQLRLSHTEVLIVTSYYDTQ